MIKELVIKGIDGYNKMMIHRHYKKQFRNYIKQLGVNANHKIEGEDEYVKKWSKFWPNVEPFSYRLFSRYCGQDANIIPEDIGQTFIEYALNPPQFQYTYSDKNIYDTLFAEGTTPPTILRRMHHSNIMDAEYKIVHDTNDLIHTTGGGKSLILKPSVGSDSGRGVVKFTKCGDKYLSVKENQELTNRFLLNYGDDFILQEAVEQHNDLNLFNPTSVNTLRIAVYRSVKDESLNVVGAILRIGKNGEICDNAHMGGVFCGINLETGEINNYVCNQYGDKMDEWNGVNFSQNSYNIPFWKEAKDFSLYVCSKLHHTRLVALDVCIDSSGTPKLIEFNTDGFSYWLFMYSGHTVFGKFTDEIIDYALDKSKEQKRLRIF